MAPATQTFTTKNTINLSLTDRTGGADTCTWAAILWIGISEQHANLGYWIEQHVPKLHKSGTGSTINSGARNFAF